MLLKRIVALALLLLAGSCSDTDSGCSGPHWPFYAKVAVKDRAFTLIGHAFVGAQFIRPEGCDFTFVGGGSSNAASSAIEQALETDRLKGRETVITGRFDGEIARGRRGDAVAIVTATRDLRVLDGTARQNALDSQFWPPRRVPDHDPDQPTVTY